MECKELVLQINDIIDNIEELVPSYLENPDDFSISKGVASVCIIDECGQIFGRVFGTDKIRCRESYKIAWTKASQVWITGIKTLEFERLVFSDQIDFYKFGINMPDMIGWEGGQPITLSDGTKLSIGFSGFRGTSDIEIVIKALNNANIAFS
jgi:uncharacterized protein GlcG (DUF336 family)